MLPDIVKALLVLTLSLSVTTVIVAALPPQAPVPPQAPPVDCLHVRSSHGNVIEFRRDSAGQWVPVGKGWRLEGGYWIREQPATWAAPVHLAPPAFAPFPMRGGGFGGGGRGGC